MEEINDLDLFIKVNDKLSEGLVVKNYKELCKILDIPIKEGNSKTAQLKTLNQFFSFRQDGYKLIIENIFDVPVIKEDHRKDTDGNRAVFVTWIESLLLNYFIQCGKTKCSFTKKQLWEMLGLVNANYTKYYKRKAFLVDMRKIDSRVRQWHIDKTYDKGRKKLNDIVRSALNSLQKRKLIKYDDNVIVARKGYESFEVTQEWQIETIMACERESIDELVGETTIDNKTGKIRPTNISDIIFNSNKAINYQKYIKLRDKKIKEELDFDFIYRRYSIICNQKFLERGLQENKDVLMQELNMRVVDAITNLVQKDFDRNREKLKEGKTKFIYPNYYMEIQKLLIMKLFDLNEKSVDEFITSLHTDAEIEELFG